jgi:hypothetical protein
VKQQNVTKPNQIEIDGSMNYMFFDLDISGTLRELISIKKVKERPWIVIEVENRLSKKLSVVILSQTFNPKIISTLALSFCSLNPMGKYH